LTPSTSSRFPYATLFRSRLGQDGVGHALLFPDQAQQQVLRAHVAVAQLTGRLLGKPQGLFRPGRKLVFIHMLLPSFLWESPDHLDRKSTRLNSSHVSISY